MPFVLDRIATIDPIQTIIVRIARFLRVSLVGMSCLCVLTAGGRGQTNGSVDNPRPASGIPAPRREVEASDPAFSYQGRFDVTDRAAPVVVWESSRISFDFEGSVLALRFGRATGQNFFNAQLDGESRIVAVEPGIQAKIAWPDPIGPGRHHLVLVKRSEASAGSVAFRGIEVAPGKRVERPAPAKAALRMLFFGDSITAGACDEDGAADQWENRRTHNAELSYAALTAYAFGADFENISVSGIGIVTGYVDVTFDEIWDRLYPVRDAPRADLSAWRPDVVFLNFGGNDTSYPLSKGLPFPASFADRYVKVLAEVRSAYPDVEMVLLRGGMSETENDPVLIAAWSDVVRRVEAHDRRCCHFVFVHHTDLHPRAVDHQRMAAELIQWLRGQSFMSALGAAPS